jgi:glycosyltransferase involved in cell wall biosynthesis
MKMKVAIIDTLGAHGGAFHFYSFGQSLGLSSCGVDVSIYTNNETSKPDMIKVKFYSFYKDIFASKFKFINGFRWICGSIRSILHARLSGISILHFHIFYVNSLVLFNILFAKLFFAKVVLTIHDVNSFDTNNKYSLASRLVYKIADLILTHNQFSKKEILKINPRLNKIIRVVPHGNYSPFINVLKDKEKSKSYLNLPNDKTVLLFFGMIKKVKGLDVLLRSFSQIVRDHPNTLLVIAGKLWRNNFKVYQQIIDANNLSNNVVVHSKFIAHDDVKHYYCASDLVILPYKKIYQSGVLMMALSYGRPVLVSDIPPFKEIITDDVNGFFFSSEDVKSLTTKLNKILSAKEKLFAIQDNGRALVNDKYDWIEIGRLLKQEYKIL